MKPISRDQYHSKSLELASKIKNTLSDKGITSTTDERRNSVTVTANISPSYPKLHFSTSYEGIYNACCVPSLFASFDQLSSDDLVRIADIGTALTVFASESEKFLEEFDVIDLGVE